ncbi:head-tail joining protein [Sphingomonas nostoxanthinifaciens]|uniref:head-tail joining protein n=1 Tax=Sphingomonas nostoxanthinifaciens TaxID=2872652 RepID=UPI001CC1D99B|nr:hypothetical protein [Sphingomonas nostoxanthinifaciens]UAK24350.1 hypothetical protein K8P63_18890 [Sphingomonas nostoxanthinifaciens]
MTDPWEAAQPIIRKAFGEAVTYAGAGLVGPTTISVIWSNVAAGDFLGPGNTARQISCEIDKALLPARPAKADRITRSGTDWKPIEVVDRDDVGAWVLMLERA